MRVIAGKAKGQWLKLPSYPVRPTSALVREAIFSMLESTTNNWLRVLDLFAGTGALGIEALSRGAEWADFVEQNPKCCAIIEQNLDRVGFASQAKVHCCSVNKALHLLKGEYNLIFSDPPYSDAYLVNTLGKVFNSKLVGAETTVVVQYSSHQQLPLTFGWFQLIKNRHYGDTCVSIYCMEEQH
jgi:16S rRNA (guanine966-N2)-methyltransferase